MWFISSEATMPRTVNAREHAAKRDGILAAAQRLVATRGYEQMTIRDLLDELGISKGALYRYFASKPELREGGMAGDAVGAPARVVRR
jgi:AcrR family transcriptional regulator